MTYKQKETPTFEKAETGIPFAPAYDYDCPPVVIDPTEWKHLCPARFGEARPTGWNGKTQWTGDSYRYDIFERIDNLGRRQLALRWWNGGGQGWLLTEDDAKRGEANMLDLIVGIADENRRWDYCHFLWEAAHKSELHGGRETEKELKQAYVDGRMRKRKVRGEDCYTVTVESEAMHKLRKECA
jgi:hypothetical protein